MTYECSDAATFPCIKASPSSISRKTKSARSAAGIRSGCSTVTLATSEREPRRLICNRLRSILPVLELSLMRISIDGALTGALISTTSVIVPKAVFSPLGTRKRFGARTPVSIKTLPADRETNPSCAFGPVAATTGFSIEISEAVFGNSATRLRVKLPPGKTVSTLARSSFFVPNRSTSSSLAEISRRPI